MPADTQPWRHGAIQSRPLPNGLTLIRDLESGSEALANRDGSFRHGVRQVWKNWIVIVTAPDNRRPSTVPYLRP